MRCNHAQCQVCRGPHLDNNPGQPKQVHPAYFAGAIIAGIDVSENQVRVRTDRGTFVVEIGCDGEPACNVELVSLFLYETKLRVQNG